MAAESTSLCTVCGRPITNGREYGRRPYCAEHLATFVDDVPSVWQASIFSFGAILLLIVSIGIGSVVFQNQPILNIPEGLILCIFPGGVWIVTLYRGATRRGHSISPLLPTVMVLGALIAAAAIRPLIRDLLAIPEWLSGTTQSNRLNGNLLLNGSINAFVLYAVVRYTVWRTPVFVRRVDGVVYSVAVGWGCAMMMASLYVIDQQSLTLLNGGLRTLSILCAYLAPAYVIGFFMGRNRFEDMPLYYLTSGVAVAAVINGLLLFAGVELNNVRLSITNDAYSPWPGMVLSFVILLLTYAAILGLLRRHNALTRARLERHE